MHKHTKHQQKKEVYIPIEIKPREFPSQVYLSGELAKKGARVFIGSKSSTDRLVNEKDNNQGVYLYKGGGSSIEKFKNVSQRVSSITVLDQEVSPALRNFDYIRTRFVAGSLKYVSRLYYIGPEVRETAVKCLNDIDPEKVLDTGWPRVDLWKPSKHHIWENEVKKIHEEFGGDFILFSADFGVNSKRLLEERSRRIEVFGAEKTKHELEFLREQQKASYKNFNQFIEFLSQMDSDSRIPPIVVRPHPAEDHKVWIERTQNLNKTKVIYRGGITPWLLASKGLLHRGCTTAIEASISQVKTGFLANFSDERNNSIVPKISPGLHNLEDVVMWANDDFNKSANEDIEKMLSNQITFPEGGATGLIAEDLVALAGDSVVQSSIKNRSMLKKVLVRILIKIKSKITKIRKAKRKNTINKMASELGKTPKANKMQDGIKSHEVKNFLDVMYPKSDFHIVQIIDDLIMVELNDK